MSDQYDVIQHTGRLSIQATDNIAAIDENLNALSSDEIRKRFHELRQRLIALENENDLLRIRHQQSEDMYTSILHTAMDGYVVTDTQGRVLEVNDTYCRMTGYGKSELLSMYVTDVEANEAMAATVNHMKQIRETGEDRFETSHRCKDGSLLDVEIRVQYKAIGDGRFVSFIRDISDIKKKEARIHQLSHLLIVAQENERHLISCELHDSIAQNLSALKIGFNAIPLDFSLLSPELKEKVDWFSKLLTQTIKDVRNLAYDLRLPGLEEMGLIKALDIYCSDASEKAKTRIVFNSAGMTEIRMDANMEIHIYRLIQEGLSNIRKHADADQANVLLLGSYPYVILRIEDNGKGFEVKKQEFLSAASKRMGIRSMQERVSMLQGLMTIHSQPMQGTKIFIKLPLMVKRDADKKA